MGSKESKGSKETKETEETKEKEREKGQYLQHHFLHGGRGYPPPLPAKLSLAKLFSVEGVGVGGRVFLKKMIFS